jgi:lysozyme family protein
VTPEFKRAVEVIFAVEGYDKVITDEGGLTKWGVSARGNPDLDIRALTREQAAQIYHDRYWKPVRGDDLPWPLSLYVFDAAVNHGTEPAAQMLQRAIGVAVDGRLGPKTVARAKAMNVAEASALFMAQRCLRYTGTRNFDKNGYGWFARLFRVAAKAS